LCGYRPVIQHLKSAYREQVERMERGEVNTVGEQRKAKVLSFEDLERAQAEAELVIKDAKKSRKRLKRLLKRLKM
jgi:predicted RNA-binding protein